MKILKLFALVVVFVSITSCDTKQKNQSEGRQEKKLILVDLGNSIKFNWNLEKEIINDDSLLHNVKEQYFKNKNILIEKIADTQLVNFSICNTVNDISNGDLAFILIDKIENLNYFDMFNIQMDTFVMNCPYPEYLFKFLRNQRAFVKEKLEDSFVKKAKTQ